MLISIGPCPISVLPCQEPTNVLSFSNSGEPGFALGSSSSAMAQTAVASRMVDQRAMNFVFIIIFFSVFVILVVRFLNTTNEPSRAGQCLLIFCQSWWSGQPRK